ncbi:MAG TPA: alpha/beta hydrolase [Rectinemataceae bacterium]|nr:alpha/beta hydrolase [Rectinemataceae bacterium]
MNKVLRHLSLTVMCIMAFGFAISCASTGGNASPSGARGLPPLANGPLPPAVGLPPGAGGPPPPFAASQPLATPAFADLAYVPNPAPTQKLDLYLPEQAKPASGYPVVVYIHGGGFALGDKAPYGDDANAVLSGLKRGYAIASINYRLSGTDKAPAQIYDVKAALRYVKANAGKYGLDPDKMVLLGVSAGGSLAALAATSANDPGFSAGLASMGAAKAGDDVAAAIILYGLYDFNTLQAQFDWLSNPSDHSFDSKYLPTYARQRSFFFGKNFANRFDNPRAFEQQYLGAPFGEKRDMIKFINAENYISAKCPPFFIRHGEMDENVPFLQSVDLAAELRAAGAKVDFATVPGAQHGLPGMNFFKKFDIAVAYDWLSTVLK